jgi:hypothetical protein
MRLSTVIALTSFLVTLTACASAPSDDEIESSAGAQSASGRPEEEEKDDGITDNGCKVVFAIVNREGVCKGTRFGVPVGSIPRKSMPVECTVLDNSCEGNFDLVYPCDVNWVRESNRAGARMVCRAFQNGAPVGVLGSYTEADCNDLQAKIDADRCTPMYKALGKL